MTRTPVVVGWSGGKDSALALWELRRSADYEIRALLSRSPLPRFTPKTKISVAQLLADLGSIRQQGYSVSEEENRLGFFSVGAVVRDATRAAVAVISGAAPTAGLKNQDRTRITRLVLQAAQKASRRLGAPHLARAAGPLVRGGAMRSGRRGLPGQGFDAFRRH